MSTNEDLIHALIAAVNQGETDTMRSLFAGHIVLHFPGRNRFAGDYFGKAAVLQFWSAHGDTLTPITLHAIHATQEQVIGVMSLHAQLPGKMLVCEGTGVYHMVQDQVTEWWMQLEDQVAFDRFWSATPAATLQIE